jgi:hypothetical protein
MTWWIEAGTNPSTGWPLVIFSRIAVEEIDEYLE